MATLYARAAGARRRVSSDEVPAMRKEVSARLSEAYDAVQQRAERYELQELSAVPSEEFGGFCPRTAVNQQVMERVIRGIDALPRKLPPASEAARLRRQAAGCDREGTARSTGHLARRWRLARWSLEGTAVRLSGQDSGRGTFSQRHLAFYDSETGKRYVPLQHISPDQARFDVLRQFPERVRGAGLRVRLQRGGPADAGDLGGAVRRFCQRRADHDRPVHLLCGSRSGASRAAW